MQADGRTIAFAKIGWNDLTRRLIETEAQALQSPAIRGLRCIETPTLMFLGQWQGHSVSVYTSIVGRPGRIRPSTDSFLEVARSSPQSCEPFGDGAFSAFLSNEARSVQGANHELANAVVSRLITLFGDNTIELGAWHGDWAPWNNAQFDSNRVVVWDWERYGVGFPIGFDEIHYRFQPLAFATNSLLGDLLSQATVDLRKAQFLGYLYAATISLRHLRPGSALSSERVAESQMRQLDALIT
jgi:hypothetical protein